MVLILTSYEDRNPFSIGNSKLQYEVTEAIRKSTSFFNSNLGTKTTAPSCVISGLSGISKTTTIRSVLSLIPQRIDHQSYKDNFFKQTQLVYVSFDCPASPSMKAFALNFFQAVDQAIGTSYFNTWLNRDRYSTEAHLWAIRETVLTHHIALVHIDEIQNILKLARSKDSPSLVYIESLFNKFGVSVVLSCTSDALTLFDSKSSETKNSYDITTSRRLMSDSQIEFKPLKVDSRDFISLFNAFFSKHTSIRKCEPPIEFKQYFHDRTCGIPAFIAKLAVHYHEYAIMLDHKVDYDIDLLDHIYKSQFSLFDAALEYVRVTERNLKRKPNEKEYENILPRDQNGKVQWGKKTQEDVKFKIAPTIKVPH
ncbi:AAA family ATPase [Aliikangiella sp. IMCC44632]